MELPGTFKDSPPALKYVQKVKSQSFDILKSPASKPAILIVLWEFTFSLLSLSKPILQAGLTYFFGLFQKSIAEKD
jgi:hypothetical protein